MDGIDFAIVLKECLHSLPFWSVLIAVVQYFMRAHQKSTDAIQKSVRNIEMSLAEANLPKIRSDIEHLKEVTTRHEILLVGKLNGGIIS